MEGLPPVDRVAEIGQELLRGLSDRSFKLTEELLQNGHSAAYWATAASQWAELLNAHAYHVAAIVAEPLRDTAWLTAVVDKACGVAGLTSERRLALWNAVSPYAWQAYGLVVPLAAGVLDTAALLLESTPWWVLWLALLVSLPGPRQGTKPTRSATSTFVTLLAGGVAAAAAAALYSQAALALALQQKSALLAFALCAGMVAVEALWRTRWLRVPVGAALLLGLACLLPAPKAAFCAARSAQCRQVLPEDVAAAQERYARSRQLQAGPHAQLAAAAEALARARPRGRATVLAVGAHELKGDLADFAILAALSPRMVFVEPNSRHLPGLRRSLDMIDAPAKNRKIISAAACETDREEATLYTSVQAATRDSFDRHYVSRHSDMKQRKVKCMSMASVLAAAEATASDVDVVILDAEGSDLKLLDALLRLPGFRPLLVRFPCCFGWEARGVPDELGPALSDLSGRGYDVFLDGGNVLAVHERVGESLQDSRGSFRY